MKRISLKNAKENMILARDVYSSNGTILLSEGQVINRFHIKKMSELGIDEILVKDEFTDDMVTQELITKSVKQECFEVINNVLSNNIINKSAITEDIINIVNKIMNNLLSNKEIILNLIEIRGIGNYTYFHSLYTMIYSILIGIKLEYNEDNLLRLGIGSLLHDIGKIKISKNIITKKGPLQDKEYEMIKLHTIMGFDILYNTYKFDQISCEIALLHHERLDGSGYPFGKTREEIPEIVKIASIGDVFDALTNDREYRKRLKPHIAIEYLLNSSTTHFDSYLVSKFVPYISLFSIGTYVLLNSREKGIVIYNNVKFPSRPVVRIIYDSEGKKLTYRKDIDLSINYNYYILDIIENLE